MMTSSDCYQVSTVRIKVEDIISTAMECLDFLKAPRVPSRGQANEITTPLQFDLPTPAIRGIRKSSRELG